MKDNREVIDVSIIIVNWNTSELLDRCLLSIDGTVNEIKYEVIVVDNASTDDSVAHIRDRFENVVIIENEENVGFAKANNQGIEVARGKYILLLNSDTFLHEGSVKTLVRYMESYPGTGVAGCRLYYEDGTLQRSCSSFPTLLTETWQLLWLDKLFPRNQVFGQYLMTYWDLDDFREVDCILGACMIIRREAIEEIGLLDEVFFMYSEEVDLCYRLKLANWKVRFVPEATATHIWGGSANQVHHTKTFLRLYRSRVLFFRKHYGIARTMLYKLILLLKSISRLMLSPFAIVLMKDENAVQKSHSYWELLKRLPSY